MFREPRKTSKVEADIYPSNPTWLIGNLGSQVVTVKGLKVEKGSPPQSCPLTIRIGDALAPFFVGPSTGI